MGYVSNLFRDNIILIAESRQDVELLGTKVDAGKKNFGMTRNQKSNKTKKNNKNIPKENKTANKQTNKQKQTNNTF